MTDLTSLFLLVLGCGIPVAVLAGGFFLDEWRAAGPMQDVPVVPGGDWLPPTLPEEA